MRMRRLFGHISIYWNPDFSIRVHDVCACAMIDDSFYYRFCFFYSFSFVFLFLHWWYRE